MTEPIDFDAAFAQLEEQKRELERILAKHGELQLDEASIEERVEKLKASGASETEVLSMETALRETQSNLLDTKSINLLMQRATEHEMALLALLRRLETVEQALAA